MKNIQANQAEQWQESISDIKYKVRIEDIAQRRYGVELKQISNGSASTYVGLCPLHEEKTPSFYVYSGEQTYHCFGCGAHGDVINLIQEKENIDFKDALNELNASAGVNDIKHKYTKKQCNELKAKAKQEREELHEKVSLEAKKRYKAAKKCSESCDSKLYLSTKVGDDALASSIVNFIGVDYVESSQGVQLIPLIDTKLKIYNLQRIWPVNENGKQQYKKFFLKGGRVKGLFFPIAFNCSKASGTMLRLKTLIIAEGVATALSIYEAMLQLNLSEQQQQSILIVSAFNAGNISHVAKAFRETYAREAKIIIAADNDSWLRDSEDNIVTRHKCDNVGLQKAYEAAKSYNCQVIYPEFPEDLKEKTPTDFNDMAKLMGLDAVAKVIGCELHEEGSSTVESKARVENGYKKAQGNRKQDTKQKKNKPTQEENLLKILESTVHEYWYSKTKRDEVGVTIKEESGNYRHLMVGSDLKFCLSQMYWFRHGKMISERCMHDAINLLRGRCMFHGKGYQVYHRIAPLKDALYYDLANDKNEVVKITADGWKVSKVPPDIKIITYSLQESQCRPVKNGDIRLLKKVANCGSDDDFAIICAYIAYCMLGRSVCPILNIYGRAGSGKSETCRKLLSLINPCSIHASYIPEREDDLFFLAKKTPVLYFDNVSSIDSRTSDWLCKISTGAGLMKRALYTDDTPNAIQANAGIIINGISDVVERGDLLERSIPIELKPLEVKESIHDLDELFEEYKPGILGGLFDMLSCALGKINKISKEIGNIGLPRMKDYVILGSACEEYLGLAKGQFLRICQGKAQDALDDSAQDDVLVQSILEIMQSECNLNGDKEQELIMSASDWLEKVRNNVKEHLHFLLPKSPDAFSKALRRRESLLATNNLSARKIRVTNGKRKIVMKYGQ